jgi:mRNA-degrading endonuclease RelE of RelBE toxin-antitoxin system
MAPQRCYTIIYAPIVEEHLKKIEPRYYTLIREEIENQLSYEPTTETRNRKPLKRPVVFGAKWELRCGPGNCFRIFYRSDPGSDQVDILAIGEKRGNHFFIGGKELEL